MTHVITSKMIDDAGLYIAENLDVDRDVAQRIAEAIVERFEAVWAKSDEGTEKRVR